MKKIGLFLLTFFAACSLSAQNLIVLDYGQGELLKHTSSLGGLGDVQVSNLSIDLMWNTKGRYYWSEWHRHPNVGLTYTASYYSNPDIGYSHSLVAFWRLERPLTSWLAYYGHVGMGLGYVSEIFDINTNSNNQSVGSHLNQSVDLRLGLRASLNPNWQAHLNARILHFSNHGIVKPNYGINIPYLSLGLAYHWTPKKTNPSIKSLEVQDSLEMEGDLLLTLGLGNRQIAFGDPASLVGHLSLEYLHPVNPIFQFGGGLTLFEDGLRYEHKKYMRSRANYQELGQLQSMAFGSHLTGLFRFGRFKVFGSLGYYWLHPHRRNREDPFLTEAYLNFMDEQNALYIYQHFGCRYRIFNQTHFNMAVKVEINKTLYLNLGITQKLN